MKKLLILIFGTISLNIFSQTAPALNLVGSTPSLSKGNINTEVLTEVIQQKQQEVEERVFRNLIVKQFNNGNETDNFKNFTTYHYLYNLMDAMLSGKNKTVITKSIISNTTEFAYIYGLALYYNLMHKGESNTLLATISGTTTPVDIFVLAKKKEKESKINDEKFTIDDGKPYTLNLTVDVIYDMLLNEENDATINSLKSSFNFKDSIADKEFSVWYNNDNVYQKDLESGTTSEKNNLIALRADVKSKIIPLLQVINSARNIHTETPETILRSLLSFKISYNDSIAISRGSSEIKQLISFYKDLEKSKFKEFTLTQDQFYALKNIMTQLLYVVKNQYEKDAIGIVIDFLLENTIVQFTDVQSNVISEASAKDLKGNSTTTTTNTPNGYLSVDVEALVSSIEQQFSKKQFYKWQPYLVPFFSMGVNNGIFVNKNNEVLKDATHTTNSVSYASEKIGIKWKWYNWKYTHSFAVGQSYDYYTKTNRWRRPQQVPLISDLYLSMYASGILYNLANLKTNNNFNCAIAGVNLGVTFFNGLALSAGLASPITTYHFGNAGTTNNYFVNLSVDIPIIDYIAALAKKKK